MPYSLELILLATAWALPLTLLHEVGHGLTALALTDGQVSISMRGGGLFGGSCTYDPMRLRRARAEVWIAAGGPAVSLVVALALGGAALETGTGFFETVLLTGSLVAGLQFVTSALPLRYGAGLGRGSESDGRMIWRIVTGAPPGGIAREERRLGEPERAARPVFVVLLVLVGVLAFLLDPLLGLMLVALFGLGALFQLSDVLR